MEKKSFKKLFLGQIALISLLILGSTAFHTDLNSDEEYENIKILITANAGMQFSKEDSPEGRKIIYDCDLGLHTSGTVNIFDNIHPKDMRSLIIKNCFLVSIEAKQEYYVDGFPELQELKISNVNFLEVVDSCERRSYPISANFKVSIRNVPSIKTDCFFWTFGSQNVSLKLENVAFDTLSAPFRNKVTEVFNLHLKNVKVKETEPRTFYKDENSKFTITIENSDFGNVHRNAFDFKGEVKIINNSFGFLDEDAFSINTSSPFIFSGNHVKGMINPFNIAAYEVDIINNTFDSITAPWLSNIISPKSDSFRVLNITDNIINHWSHNLFYLDPLNLPDFINFDGNYLNCTCRNALSVGSRFQTYITEIFLNKQRNNFCHNFGNCPLHKALKERSKICRGTFQCPEDQNEDDEDFSEGEASHLKSILSVLKNIDTKLEQIVSKYNSLLPDKPN